MRQNIAEIDEIPAVEHIRMLTLPPAERAIYLELAHHLQAMEMNHKKYKKGARACGDREARMAAILGESQSAEEARAHAAAAAAATRTVAPRTERSAHALRAFGAPF